MRALQSLHRLRGIQPFKRRPRTQKRRFAGACFPDETRELTDWRGIIEYEDAWQNIIQLGALWIQFFSMHFMVDRWFIENELEKLEPGFVYRPGSFKMHANPNIYVPTFADE